MVVALDGLGVPVRVRTHHLYRSLAKPMGMVLTSQGGTMLAFSARRAQWLILSPAP
jgi:hypothetical protein